jgi:exoribonuclease-2
VRVDVAALWQVLADAGAPAAAVRLEDLAELALGETDGIARTAVYLALLGEGAHFTLKGERWVPRAAEALDEILRERERVAARDEERAAFLAAAAAAGRGQDVRPEASETAERYLDALLEQAVHEDAASAAAQKLAAEALAAAALRFERPHEGAFRLLLRLGRFASADENLQPLRFGLRTEFPAIVAGRAAARAERGFDREGRHDLRGQPAVSIDGPHTREIDDLLHVERGPSGGFRLAVHIADPAAYVEPGDPVDAEALARGLTHYMPDLRLPMIPAAISEGAASLSEGAERPALSFLVSLDAGGHVSGFEIARSIVRSAARLTYDGADRAIETGAGEPAAMLRVLAEVADLREQVRATAGAVTIRSDEVDVHLTEDGVPELDRLAADSLARRAVTEAMILTGEVAARFAAGARIPLIHRRQAIAERLEVASNAGADPVLRRRLRRALTRAETGLEPGPHDSLGLDAYAQVSSPLRRFQDLANHRQIAASLAGRAPCYDREALQRIAATTEQAEADARRAEQAADDYWILRFLEGQRGLDLDAIVVEIDPRPVVLLVETMREQPLGGLEGVEPGQAIRVRIEHVNPRAGRLVLRRTG